MGRKRKVEALHSTLLPPALDRVDVGVKKKTEKKTPSASVTARSNNSSSRTQQASGNRAGAVAAPAPAAPAPAPATTTAATTTAPAPALKASASVGNKKRWKKKRKRNKNRAIRDNGVVPSKGEALTICCTGSSTMCKAVTSGLTTNLDDFTAPASSQPLSTTLPSPLVKQESALLLKPTHKHKLSPRYPPSCSTSSGHRRTKDKVATTGEKRAYCRKEALGRCPRNKEDDCAPQSPKKREKGMMTPSEVLRQLVPLGGWQLTSCWSATCNCTMFTTTGGAPGAALTGICSCGHLSVAHELVDAQEEDAGKSPQFRRSIDGRQKKRQAERAQVMSRGGGLRRLFADIRNARAVGASSLFEDSEGVCGWGTGWFLSMHARRYLKQAREVIAELGQGLHNPSAVTNCLTEAEGLMSGSAAGGMPRSLPLSTIYQVLGTRIASELDLAYWHVRYTASTRYGAGGVAANSPCQIVPPPEVYFLCLASHLPSAAELRASPGLKNLALRAMLADVFDLPVGLGQHVGKSRSDGGTGVDEIEFPVLSNPLLAVTQSAWLETAMLADAKSWVSHFPLRFGEPEGSMRGSDPALPVPIRARCDAVRDWSARLLAFAVPNRLAVDACRRALKACGGTASAIVEVGAGLGYWKWVLEGSGTGDSDRIGCEGPRKGGGNDGDVPNSDVSPEASSRGSKQQRTGARATPSRVERGRPVGARTSKAESADVVLRVLAIDKDAAQLPIPDGDNLFATVETLGRTGGGLERRQQGGQGACSRRGRGKSGKVWRGDSVRSPQAVQAVTAATAFPNNEYHGGAPAWAVVETGGPERLRSVKADAYPVLLLCYPPPSIGGAGDAAAAACMGANALATFSGKVLLYVGEVGGDTGSPRLEAMLQAEWDLVEAVELPCYSSTANQLMVFVRKGVSLKHGSVIITSATMPRHLPLYRCSSCVCSPRGTGAQLHRCRLTRAVSYCSERCFSGDLARWQANLEARHIYLPIGAAGGLVGAGEIGPSNFGGGSDRFAQSRRAIRDKKIFKRLTLHPL